MNKLRMQTANKADENFRKLAAMFPNAVTETINENGEGVRAIDKQEVARTVMMAMRTAISSRDPTRNSNAGSIRRCTPAVRKA